jgi:hypothetical protein
VQSAEPPHNYAGTESFPIFDALCTTEFQLLQFLFFFIFDKYVQSVQIWYLNFPLINAVCATREVSPTSFITFIHLFVYKIDIFVHRSFTRFFITIIFVETRIYSHICIN